MADAIGAPVVVSGKDNLCVTACCECIAIAEKRLLDVAMVINFAIECDDVIAVLKRLMCKVAGIHDGEPPVAQGKVGTMIGSLIIRATVRYTRIHATDQCILDMGILGVDEHTDATHRLTLYLSACRDVWLQAAMDRLN